MLSSPKLVKILHGKYLQTARLLCQYRHECGIHKLYLVIIPMSEACDNIFHNVYNSVSVNALRYLRIFPYKVIVTLLKELNSLFAHSHNTKLTA